MKNLGLSADTGVTEWFAATDGLRQFIRSWKSEAESAVLLYIHGIEGHSLWFSETAAELRKAGITTYAVDRRGAGGSEGIRGHVDNYQRLLADIEETVHFIRRRHKNMPLFLMANCWGAKPAVLLIAQRPGLQLSGLILTSPAVSVQVDADLMTKLKIAVSYLVAKERPFAIPLTPEHFTDEPRYLQFIEEDSLRLREATAAFFVESTKLTWLSNKAAPAIKLPLLLLQSGQDKIVKLAGIEKWFEQVRSSDKTVIHFPDSAHSLDFQHDQSAYRDALIGWIRQRTGR